MFEWRFCCLLLATVQPAGLAQAAERGWLAFTDGNLISGELVQFTENGGQFRADRFGEMQFSASEATFKPGVVVQAASPAEQKPREPAAVPHAWSVTGVLAWEDEDDDEDYDFDIDLNARWQRLRDDVNLSL